MQVTLVLPAKSSQEMALSPVLRGLPLLPISGLWLRLMGTETGQSPTHIIPKPMGSSLSACLWVVQCRAHSPASLKVFLEVYYLLLHIPDASHWLFLGPSGGQEVRGKALVQLLAAELGCRRPVCSHETSHQVGGVLGVTASLSPPKRDPGRAGNSKSFGDGRI